MTGGPPSQVLRHLLERSTIQSFLTSLHALLERANLKFTRFDELVDIQCAIRECLTARLGTKGSGIALPRTKVIFLLSLVGIIVRLGRCRWILSLFGGVSRLASRLMSLQLGHCASHCYSLSSDG